MESFHATTIISVRRNGKVVIGGDGQVTLGNTVVKGNARKIRRLGKAASVLAGFAGATADAFTLFELFEAKLDKHGGNLTRATTERFTRRAIRSIDSRTAPVLPRPGEKSSFVVVVVPSG